MDQSTIGLIGGIVGSVVGVLGGVIGTYFSIKNAKTTAERRLVVRCAFSVWVEFALLIGLPLALWLVGVIPQWFYLVAYALFYISLALLIFWAKKALYNTAKG